MKRRPPGSTRTYPLFPDTTLCRSRLRPSPLGRDGYGRPAACLVRPARLRHARGSGAAGNHALPAGARAAPPRLPRVAARAAATDRTRDHAVPHHRRGLRSAEPAPADQAAVRSEGHTVGKTLILTFSSWWTPNISKNIRNTCDA